MVNELRAAGYEPQQFKLDQSRPDLDKLDTLFGLLSSETSSFQEQVQDMEVELSREGIQKVFEALTIKDATRETPQM